VIGILFALLNLYSWVIVIRAILSWFGPSSRNPLVALLIKITEPVLEPLRTLVPPEKLGGLDISPILAFAGIQVIKYLLLNFNF
jgi:YggT family protein